MVMEFLYLSGSPFTWKIWLALEHAELHYEPRRLRVDQGDLRTDRFLALNPKGKLPVLIDGDLVLSESDAIAEYLAEIASENRKDLWPDHERDRALARRFASTATAYVYPALRRIMEQTLFLQDGVPDGAIIAVAKSDLAKDFAILSDWLQGDYAAGEAPTLADYALYPFIALLRRIDNQRPGYKVSEIIPRPLRTWAGRIEALPWFERTIPPHWKEG